jgi:subtilisin-like proprotein convertase family protein
MDTRRAEQWIVRVPLIAVFFCCPVFAVSNYVVYGGEFDLSIPADPEKSSGWMHDAAVDVPDDFIIHDLDVTISITHTRVFDLQLFLESPAGTRICLNMYDFRDYFEGGNYTSTIFDDEADLSIAKGSPPFTGRFRPVEPYRLSVFDGEKALGTWRLQICDMWDADVGTLNSFHIMLTIPEPASALILLLGAALICLSRSRTKPRPIEAKGLGHL